MFSVVSHCHLTFVFFPNPPIFALTPTPCSFHAVPNPNVNLTLPSGVERSTAICRPISRRQATQLGPAPTLRAIQTEAFDNGRDHVQAICGARFVESEACYDEPSASHRLAVNVFFWGAGASSQNTKNLRGTKPKSYWPIKLAIWELPSVCVSVCVCAWRARACLRVLNCVHACVFVLAFVRVTWCAVSGLAG
jgi:hypothetical protein